MTAAALRSTLTLTLALRSPGVAARLTWLCVAVTYGFLLRRGGLRVGPPPPCRGLRLPHQVSLSFPAAGASHFPPHHVPADTSATPVCARPCQLGRLYTPDTPSLAGQNAISPDASPFLRHSTILQRPRTGNAASGSSKSRLMTGSSACGRFAAPCLCLLHPRLSTCKASVLRSRPSLLGSLNAGNREYVLRRSRRWLRCCWANLSLPSVFRSADVTQWTGSRGSTLAAGADPQTHAMVISTSQPAQQGTGRAPPQHPSVLTPACNALACASGIPGKCAFCRRPGLPFLPARVSSASTAAPNCRAPRGCAGHARFLRYLDLTPPQYERPASSN